METPTPGPGEIFIEVAAGDICGTDLRIYHGEYEGTCSIIPGHEFSSTVAAVGEGVKPPKHKTDRGNSSSVCFIW